MELFKDKTLVRILFLRCIHHEIVQYLVSLTLLRMWEREVKRLPTSFSPATCTKVGISSLNFLFLVLTLFKVIPSVSPKLLNLNQDQLSKKVVFLVNSS